MFERHHCDADRQPISVPKRHPIGVLHCASSATSFIVWGVVLEITLMLIIDYTP